MLNVLLGLESRCSVSSLLVAEKRLDRLAPLIERLASEVPVYAAGQAVMDAIVGFHIHRGILAHGARAPDPGAEALLAGLGPRALVLALFGISNHDNMGGLFRNAAAFGADAVLLDAACCDPLYRKGDPGFGRRGPCGPLRAATAWREPAGGARCRGFHRARTQPRGRRAGGGRAAAGARGGAPRRRRRGSSGRCAAMRQNARYPHGGWLGFAQCRRRLRYRAARVDARRSIRACRLPLGDNMLTRRSISAGVTAVAFSGSAAARATPTNPWPNAAKAAVSLTYDDALNSQLDNAAAALPEPRA